MRAEKRGEQRRGEERHTPRGAARVPRGVARRGRTDASSSLRSRGDVGDGDGPRAAHARARRATTREEEEAVATTRASGKTLHAQSIGRVSSALAKRSRETRSVGRGRSKVAARRRRSAAAVEWSRRRRRASRRRRADERRAIDPKCAAGQTRDRSRLVWKRTRARPDLEGVRGSSHRMTHDMTHGMTHGMI
jgi:hypothetical protein